jgi:hypothetical protein
MNKSVLSVQYHPIITLFAILRLSREDLGHGGTAGTIPELWTIGKVG